MSTTYLTRARRIAVRHAGSFEDRLHPGGAASVAAIKTGDILFRVPRVDNSPHAPHAHVGEALWSLLF